MKEEFSESRANWIRSEKERSAASQGFQGPEGRADTKSTLEEGEKQELILKAYLQINKY